MSNEILVISGVVSVVVTALVALAGTRAGRREAIQEWREFSNLETKTGDEILAAMKDPLVSEETLLREAEFRLNIKALEAEHRVEFDPESLEQSLKKIRKINRLAEMESMPPKKARLALLFWVSKPAREALEGDIMQTYREIQNEFGKRSADRFFWKETIRVIGGMTYDFLIDVVFGRLIDLYRKAVGG